MATGNRGDRKRIKTPYQLLVKLSTQEIFQIHGKEGEKRKKRRHERERGREVGKSKKNKSRTNR